MSLSIRTGWRGTVAYLAGAWAVLFSLVHVYWLSGGTVGLPSGRSLYDNTPLLVAVIAAVPAGVVVATLALALVRPWGRLFPRWLLLVAAWVTGIGLIAHAVPLLPDWVMLVSGAKLTSELDADGRFSALVYEPWFVVGGILFCVAALGYHRGFRLFRSRAVAEPRVEPSAEPGLHRGAVGRRTRDLGLGGF